MNRSASDEQHVLRMTVLPFRLSARAWVDAQFRDELLRSPRAHIIAHSAYFPRDCTYLVPPDTPSLKHYSIPFTSSAIKDLGESAVLTILEEEIGDTPHFDAWLPPKVIAKAMFDSEFLANLIARGVSSLRREGYKSSTDICIVQHSPTSFCMPLRFNHLSTLVFHEALTEIRGDAAVIESSRCCQSGTCCN